MNTKELAWASGFFDGEGCTFVTKVNRGTRLVMAVAQTSSAVLERFAAAVGAGNINGPYGGRTAKSSPYWQLSITNWRTTQAVYCKLWPMLSRQKKDQILKCVAKFRERPEWGQYRGEASKGRRKVFCKRGHPFVDGSFWVSSDSSGSVCRTCKECRRLRTGAPKG